jgi:MarR family transcriptional regulator for hemolysin
MELPLGKTFHLLTKNYVGIVSKKLSDIEIDRYYYIICVLNESKEAMCQKDLAGCVGVDNVTMVRIVDYLSRKKFVKRLQSKFDRRAYELELTEKAKKAMPQIAAAFDEANQICFKGFSRKEKNDFQNLLMKMFLNAESYPRVEVNMNYKKIKKSK